MFRIGAASHKITTRVVVRLPRPSSFLPKFLGIELCLATTALRLHLIDVHEKIYDRTYWFAFRRRAPRCGRGRESIWQILHRHTALACSAPPDTCAPRSFGHRRGH